MLLCRRTWCGRESSSASLARVGLDSLHEMLDVSDVVGVDGDYSPGVSVIAPVTVMCTRSRVA